MNMLYCVTVLQHSHLKRLTILTDVRRGPSERENAKAAAIDEANLRYPNQKWSCTGIQAVCETPSRVLMMIIS